MKKTYPFLTIGIMTFFSFFAPAFASGAGPTRTVTQQTGAVLAEGEVNADLTILDGTQFYTSRFSYQGYVPNSFQVNMGIWNGELQIGGGYGTEISSGSAAIGYKFKAGEGAAYGRLNVNAVTPSPATPAIPKTGDFDFTVGYSYTRNLQKGILNLNGEVTLETDYRNTGPTSVNISNSVTRMNAATIFPIASGLSFVGEVSLDMNNNPSKQPIGTSATDLLLGAGLRVNPNSRATLDLMLVTVAAMSGNGKPFDILTGFGTPVMARANFSF